jgi:hypothetical protein
LPYSRILFYIDNTTNFGAGGMLIKTVGNLHWGPVAWTNYPESPSNPSLPGGMGIQFLNLTTEELTVIRDYIKREFIKPNW